MTPDTEDSSLMSPAESGKPDDATLAEIEELEALSHAQSRSFAMVSAARLFGIVFVIGTLAAICAFAYIKMANQSAKAREKLENEPFRAMENLLRATGKEKEADQIFSNGIDFSDVERQLRENTRSKRK